MEERLVLVTGATGYVGGRLLKLLEKSGARLRCLARRPEFLKPRVAESTQVVYGDLQDPESLEAALRDVHTAYYLVHSMASGTPFEEADRRAADLFVEAAKKTGLRRIIYLGGLGRGADLSGHLASRQEVGRILRDSGIPTLEFQASIVIGSGSLSFEMIRALVERLPVMVTPRWVNTEAQPIAIEDLVEYLVRALDLAEDRNEVFEVGGADQVSYREIMREYARQRGLRRLLIRVPVLTPRLSSLWLGLVTPVYARVGRELIDGVRNATVVHDDRALREFAIRPRGIREAIERALAHEDRELAETHWADALSSSGDLRQWGGVRFRNRIIETHTREVPCPPAQAFRPIRRIGGDTGWYFASWMWQVRGLFDLFFGGPGMRRGRRDPENLLPGDAVDFWRVEDVKPNKLLRLSAEMRLPGRAWLQFEVQEEGEGSLIRQTAFFDPVGLSGLLYWYILYPPHQLVFRGMLRGIARAARRGR